MRTYQFANKAAGVFAGIVGIFERQDHPTLGAVGLRSPKLWQALVVCPFGCTWLSVYDENKLIFHGDVSDALLRFADNVKNPHRTADGAAFIRLESMDYKNNRMKAESQLLEIFTPLIDGAINEQHRKARPSRSKRRNGKPIPSSGCHDVEDQDRRRGTT